MKKLITTLCAVLVCGFLFSATTVEAKSAAYERTTTKNNQTVWSNGTNKVYLKSNKAYTKQNLYLKNVKSGKTKLLKTFQLNMEDDGSYSIGNVYGTTIYLNRIKGAGDGDLYTYNWKTAKYKKLKTDFVIMDASGKTLITADYQPTDISPLTQYIYKITDKGLQKVKTIGKHITQAQFVDGMIYYSKYPKDGSIRNMSVCRCDQNGENVETLFKASAADKNGYVMLQKVSRKNIDYIEVPADGDQLYYRYNMKTQKITQITDKEASK